MEASLFDRIEALMQQNRRTEGEYVYTVPSPELYPFQWLWDSCFHSIILSYFDIEAARAELRSAVARPLKSGILPHIVYWKSDSAQTNWGREMRGDIITNAWGTPGTSSITQPPVIASALAHVHLREPRVDFLEELYPTLRAHYIQLVSERDPDEIGVLGIINPDESGEDNSPRFDHAQELPQKHDAFANLDKRMRRIEQLRACSFDVPNCMREHFWVEDVAFNAILTVALRDLAAIARELGVGADAKLFETYAEKIETAMKQHFCTDGICYSLEGEKRTPIKVDTWNLFMPLYAGILSPEEARLLIEEYLLDKQKFWTPYAVPSTALDDPHYEVDGFWRGPTWMAPNWFIYKGLKRYGYDELAAQLREKSVAMIDKSGFREHYDPQTGIGLGAHDFTWGGLVIDMN